MKLPARAAVFAAISAELDRLLKEAEAAATFARETATAKENAAENKYDTLGLEAAYLAHGQSERAATLLQDRATFERLANLATPSSAGAGALVLLSYEAGGTRCFLLAPCQGGLAVTADGTLVHVVTPEAPLGRALLGQSPGDEITTPTGPAELLALQ